jgi:signal peptidase I
MSVDPREESQSAAPVSGAPSIPTTEEGPVSTGKTILYAILIALAIRMFALEPFNIPSSSMVPNLLIGDYLFVSKYSYGYSSLSTFFGLAPYDGRLFASEPKRGDVVVFKLPRDHHIDYIKRLVGLPGDRIQMKHGLLYINGVPAPRELRKEPLAQKYLMILPNAVDYTETFPEGTRHVIRKEGDANPLDDTDVFVVPPGHYFMMGDNRDNSLDSRTTNVGFVPRENLVGRAEFLFFSFDETSSLLAFWNWPSTIRWGRLFTKIE